MSDCEDDAPYYIPEHEEPLIRRSGTPSWGATRCSVNYPLETARIAQGGRALRHPRDRRAGCRPSAHH
eukprot:7743844-Alexandrium_andersonii.AAC.2